MARDDTGRSDGGIAALQAGDRQAQAAFWAEQLPRVRALCARVLGRGPDAEELAQDVLTEFVFERAPRLERPEAAYAYLKLMALRRAQRYRERRRELPEEELPVPVDGDALDAIERRGEAAALGRLGECLGRLTEKARKVLQLRYGSELTNEHIGELVGGSKQYIGKLLRKSLEALRSCLGV